MPGFRIYSDSLSNIQDRAVAGEVPEPDVTRAPGGIPGSLSGIRELAILTPGRAEPSKWMKDDGDIKSIIYS